MGVWSIGLESWCDAERPTSAQGLRAGVTLRDSQGGILLSLLVWCIKPWATATRGMCETVAGFCRCDLCLWVRVCW